MATSPLTGIAGSIDGQIPQYDPDATWKMWNMDEIFFGEIGLHKYVPKVKDFVIDTSTLKRSEVTAIDPLTLIPTLRPLDEDANGNGLIGDVGDSTWIAYLDQSVTPHKLALDARWRVYGTMSLYAKIFKGTNVGSTGKLLSMLYDSSGHFLTNDIPLEDASIDDHLNISTKVVQQCSTMESLPDGELVTCVVYDAQGHVVHKRTFRVENTGYIRSVAAGTKYISHISVKSPFLSTTDSNKLEYPINVPLQAFNMIGVVHYSDGSTIELPVDNTRFIMRGLERFVSSVPGQDIPLVFSYALAPQEVAYGNVSIDGKMISQAMRLVSTVQNDAFTVKLFGYPVWIDNILGYQMKWFMFDLTREIFFEVTPHVLYNQNSDVYNPLGYNQVQNLSVRLNLKNVSNSFASYIHTQTMTVMLKEPGTALTTNWLLASEQGQSPFYGENLYATTHMVNQNLWKVNVSAGLANQTDWLLKVFTYTRPLFDRLKEISAPVPTHFVVLNGNQRHEFPIDQYNQDLIISSTVPTSGTLFIEFIRRLPNNAGDLRLSIAGLNIRNV